MKKTPIKVREHIKINDQCHTHINNKFMETRKKHKLSIDFTYNICSDFEIKILCYRKFFITINQKITITFICYKLSKY